MKRLIIFDLDDTFYEYEGTHKRALKKVFQVQNIFDDYQEFLVNYEKTKQHIHNILLNNPSRHSKLIYFKNLFWEKLNITEIIQLENVYWEDFIKNANVDIESIKILKKNKDQNNIYFLFTNQNLHVQLKKIDRWGLNFFDKIITSEEVGFEKPTKEFFTYSEKFVKEFVQQSYSVFALGDNYKNDIEFWTTNYEAKGYQIDNKIDKIIKNDQLTKANFKNAIFDIYHE